MGYADDLKPAVTSMQDFLLVDQAYALFERNSCCKLHRDPASGKCKFLPLTQHNVPCAYMVLSDHLDMLGVELKATHTKTRKVNGDALQTRVKNTIGPWHSEKFMPLTQRPWSVNSFAVSKILYKCNCLDLRVVDTTNITSKVKAWLLADQLEKPEDMINYRPTSHGGLGLHHVKYKALAMHVHSFLETSVNPKYLHNLYHTSLFRYYVLQHQDLPDPGLPPYYSLEFFSQIRSVHENTPLNVATMSCSQWYTLLLEDNITMKQHPVSDARQLKPSRTELASPDNDWDRSWHLARLKGLGPDMTSFLWKVLHKLLPSQDRLSRILPNKTPLCQLCQDQVVEDLPHAFFQCRFNGEAGTLLLNCLSAHMPRPSPNQVLTLGFDTSTGEELPLVWFTGFFLQNIWSARIQKKQPQLFSIRADLEARASILRETRHRDAAIVIGEMSDLCFNGIIQ